MKRSLYQYFFFLLLVILTCGGTASLHEHNHDVQVTSTVSIPTISTSVPRKSTHSQQNKVGISHRNPFQYTQDYQTQQQLLGEINDSNSEEDNSENETHSTISKIANADLWKAIYEFVNTFHTIKSAVYFAHSGFLNFPVDLLYIQYSVFRL